MADGGVALQGYGHRQVDGAGQADMDQGQEDRQQLLVQARQLHAAKIERIHGRKRQNVVFILKNRCIHERPQLGEADTVGRGLSRDPRRTT
jgi:hypothetical protein